MYYASMVRLALAHAKDEDDEFYVEDLENLLAETISREEDFMSGRMDAEIVKRFYNDEIQVVTINEWPNTDQFECYSIVDLSHDLSQGSGNVISRYFYVPAIDILLNYVDC